MRVPVCMRSGVISSGPLGLLYRAERRRGGVMKAVAHALENVAQVARQ